MTAAAIQSAINTSRSSIRAALACLQKVYRKMPLTQGNGWTEVQFFELAMHYYIAGRFATICKFLPVAHTAPPR